MLTIVIFVVIFSLLILIHELGHFTAAKRAGVKVEEFGMGLPPRIFGVQRGETLYSINWIPFGGFVRMLGEDPSQRGAKTSKRSFMNQPLRTQALIVSAGVIMNFLLAFVLLTIGFWFGIEPLMVDEEDFIENIRQEVIVVEPAPADEEGVFHLSRLVYSEDPDSVFDRYLEDGDVILELNGEFILDEQDLYSALQKSVYTELLVYRDGSEVNISPREVVVLPQYPLIQMVQEESPAAEAGLQVGDQVVSMNGEVLRTAEDVVSTTQALEPGVLVDYQIYREDELIELSLELNEERRIGIVLTDYVPYYGNLSLYHGLTTHRLVEVQKLQYGFLKAPVVAVDEMWRLSKATAVMFVNVLGDFLTFDEIPAGVSGPVGIAEMTFLSVQEGFAAVLRLVALLSLSLGVINILPLPALDGGHLAFIIMEGVSGRKPNAKLKHWIHLVGFVLLILFIFYITFNDVMNLF